MNYALIFAGGVGKRMHSQAIPKQFMEVKGKPIIVYTLEHFMTCAEIDAICLVIVKDWINYMIDITKEYNLTKVQWIIPGGETALDSQYLGLKTIASKRVVNDNDIVLIHDGVRPLINNNLISECITSVKQYASAVTVAPAIETVVQVDQENMIHSTVERSKCYMARAPQCFYLKDILKIHNMAISEGRHNFIDSTSMMLYYGHKVHIVMGPMENIKVTTPSDYHICMALLSTNDNNETKRL